MCYVSDASIATAGHNIVDDPFADTSIAPIKRIVKKAKPKAKAAGVNNLVTPATAAGITVTTRTVDTSDTAGFLDFSRPRGKRPAINASLDIT